MQSAETEKLAKKRFLRLPEGLPEKVKDNRVDNVGSRAKTAREARESDAAKLRVIAHSCKNMCRVETKGRSRKQACINHLDAPEGLVGGKKQETVSALVRK